MVLCLPCLAPLAIAAASGTAVGAGKKKSYILYWITVSILLTIIITLIYFLYFKKCTTCLAS